MRWRSSSSGAASISGESESVTAWITVHDAARRGCLAAGAIAPLGQLAENSSGAALTTDGRVERVYTGDALAGSRGQGTGGAAQASPRRAAAQRDGSRLRWPRHGKKRPTGWRELRWRRGGGASAACFRPVGL